MGTVGLSFGSPTSGAGFDVSSTVAAIVANLQNVETPWKNQLTTLESPGHGDLQPGHAVLESLQRHQRADRLSGGPGGEDRLQLRHQCADADRGQQYGGRRNAHGDGDQPGADLQRLSGADHKCLGHAFRLRSRFRWAAGTAQTITLNSSDNTLAGLAAAINSSGVGVTASVLTDASGRA